MNIKAFFVDALTSALDLGIATPDDVLAHVTPDVLAANLPRPLWARLLTACVGAPKVDAQLVIETVGVSNLCEHVPSKVIWSCVATIGARALGGEAAARAAVPVVTAEPPASGPTATPLSITSPPAPEPKTPPAPRAAVRGPNIPKPGTSPSTDVDVEDRTVASPARARTASQRFRQTSTNIGRLATTNQRRPQAQAQASAPAPASAPASASASDPVRRRSETDVELEVETSVGTREDWRTALAVEDDQLVDWSTSDETETSAGDEPAFRKR